MPKFLDVPQWYLTNGTQVNGVGCQNLYGITAIAPATCTVNGDLKSLAASVNNSSQGFNIYAPIAAGTAGQALISSGSGAPEWNNLFDYQVISNTNTGNGPGAHYSDSRGGSLDIYIPKRSEKTQYSCYFCGGIECGNNAIGITFDTYLDVNNSYVTATGIAIAIGCKGIEGKPWMATPYNPAVLQDYIRVTYRFSIFTDSAFENISVRSGILYYVYKETN